MVTLRVVAEDAIAHGADGVARYAGELTRALIRTAPRGCDVELLFAARSAGATEALKARFPGARRATAARLPRPALALAWRFGADTMASRAGSGFIHAPSLFAPLLRHDDAHPTQLSVTVHDTVAWTHPDALPSGVAAWQRAMTRRAARLADAIVVPTHAVAATLEEHVRLGDRVRVIPGAVSPSLALPDDAEARAARLRLPERYVLAIGDLERRKSLRELLAALALPAAQGVPLLVVGPDDYFGDRTTTAAMLAGLPEGRVRVMGRVPDAELAVLLDRAAMLVHPSLAEGFGLSVLEAFSFGTPVVHSDDPSLVEVAGGAGIVVLRTEGGATYPERLAEAIGRVLDDATLAARLGVAGRDRARAFSWQDSGRRVWQLHAEL